jgi:ribosome maturation factor RimP
MTEQTPIQAVEKLMGPLLTDDVFLVSVRVKPTNNIKIFLDADSGMTIERCIRINRALYKLIVEMGLYPDGEFSLEVSSPGVDEPLKLFRQYEKNRGRNVEVILTDDSRKEGLLSGVSEEAITIEYTEGRGKKAVVKKEVIPFDGIRQTKVQVKF